MSLFTYVDDNLKRSYIFNIRDIKRLANVVQVGITLTSAKRIKVLSI